MSAQVQAHLAAKAAALATLSILAVPLSFYPGAIVFALLDHALSAGKIVTSYAIQGIAGFAILFEVYALVHFWPYILPATFLSSWLGHIAIGDHIKSRWLKAVIQVVIASVIMFVALCVLQDKLGLVTDPG
jgi:uncharacterized membrane protein